MRYIVTVIWAFLLSMMTEFVLASMLYVSFNFTRGLVLTVAISFFVFLIPLLMPKDSEIYDLK
ncbi:YjzD family protein [Listeria sp. PSOL-1]|uniref:YjzD family protein n=1 Tax=Listeria sp. PSOL-1 TaxID=1844999 RepID=UPI0013D660ED|nr:YjzD family protein [Listeria sp. PSOL-1]